MTRLFTTAMAAGLAAVSMTGIASSAASQPSTPVAGAPVAAPAQAAKVADADKPICKTKPDLGSHLGGTRICLTRAQWAERAREDHNALDDMVNDNSGRH
jgi:hypothetical protein